MPNKFLILAICAAMMSSCSSRINKQNAVNLPGNIILSIIRTPLKGDLPEYKRTAILYSGDQQLASWELFPDTGGTLRINVYLLKGDRILLRDRIVAYEIDPVSKSLTETNIEKGEYLGCFNQDENHNWRFLSAEKSPEIPIVGDGRVE